MQPDRESAGDWIPIGRIVGAHGLKGWVRLRLYGDAADALAPGTRLRVLREDAPLDSELVRATPGRRSDELRLALDGVSGRDAAEALRGCELLAPRAALGDPGDDTVWGHDLLGCRLESADGTPLGRVAGIWDTGADVLVVEAPDGRELLVPAALLVEVDVSAGRAVAEIPPGLLDEPE